MNIAYHSSDKFASALGTSIASLLENNKEADNIDIFIVERDISSKNKEKLNDLVHTYNRSLFFIEMPDINQKENLGLKQIKENWLFDSYCRLFLDHILPEEISRVIYLDSDVLVANNVSELWDYDLQGKCVGAVKECIGPNYFDLFGLNDNSVYCNSGVLLIDLNRWREKKCDRLVQQYVQSQNGYVFFMEQSVLNIALQDEIITLPAIFNVKTEMQTLSYHEIEILRKPVNWFSEDEFNEAVRCPTIIHMTSFWMISNRAWYDVTNHPSKQLYLKYKLMTDWKDESGEHDSRSNIRKLLQVLIDKTPRKVLLPFISFVYNHVRIWKIKWDMTKLKRKE